MTSSVNGLAKPLINSPSPGARNSSSTWSASTHMASSFSLRRLGVISRISSERWLVWVGGSSVGSWSLNGSSSRCSSISSVMSEFPRPSRDTGKPGNGPVTEMHDDHVSASFSTAQASSQPVTMVTPWWSSRVTGHCCRSDS